MIRLLAFQAQREKIPCSGNSCARTMAHLLLAGYEYAHLFLTHSHPVEMYHF
jgi:hypothetical protein